MPFEDEMKFFKKGDIIIIAAILAVGILAWLGHDYLTAEKSPKAEIYYYSRLVKTVDLGESEEMTFHLEEDEDVVFQVDGKGAIRFLESDCPDKVCIKTGELHQVGEFAACLPNNIIVKIVPKDERSSEDPDIIIGR